VLSTTDGAPVELTARPGSETDRLARQLMAPELERARARGIEKARMDATDDGRY
jgi:hypothetical protein